MAQITSTKRAGQFVNTKHVDSLLSAYKKERWADNSKRLGKEDSLSVWYGLEELENFLQTARKNGADGIKMYFGVYKADTAKDERFEDRQTVVLVASKTKLLDSGASVDKSIYITNDNQPEILAFNVGRVCPPACGTGVPPPGGTEISTGFDWDNPGILIDRKKEGMMVI